jgi:hypothetical protein
MCVEQIDSWGLRNIVLSLSDDLVMGIALSCRRSHGPLPKYSSKVTVCQQQTGNISAKIRTRQHWKTGHSFPFSLSLALSLTLSVSLSLSFYLSLPLSLPLLLSLYLSFSFSLSLSLPIILLLLAQTASLLVKSFCRGVFTAGAVVLFLCHWVSKPASSSYFRLRPVTHLSLSPLSTIVSDRNRNSHFRPKNYRIFGFGHIFGSESTPEYLKICQ